MELVQSALHLDEHSWTARDTFTDQLGDTACSDVRTRVQLNSLTKIFSCDCRSRNAQLDGVSCCAECLPDEDAAAHVEGLLDYTKLASLS
jgi:hypothetical protein